MSVAAARNREFFGKVSGSYRVQAADTGVLILVAAPRLATIFVQKIHIEVTTPSGAELWTFQDGQGNVLVPSVSAAAVAHFDFNFGPDGVPCAAATAFVLNITGAIGAIGWITWEAFQQLVPAIDYASMILALNPLAYWRFEEPGGNLFMDASGNAHHAFGGGGIAGGPGADSRGVIFRKPSVLANGTYGIQATNPDGLGVFPITLTVSPSTLRPTDPITVSWAGIPAGIQAATNWITITKVGNAQSAYIGWMYITNSGAGSLTMALNATVGGALPAEGRYDVRLYYQDTYNILQQVLAQVVISTTAVVGGSGAVASSAPVPLVLGTTCTLEGEITVRAVPASTYGFICGDVGNNGLYANSSGGFTYLDLFYAGADHRTTPITLGTRYYFAIVCAAGAVTFYLNGVPAGTAAGWPGLTIATLLNSYPTGNLPYIGDLDELVLYGTALSPDILADHAARWI